MKKTIFFLDYEIMSVRLKNQLVYLLSNTTHTILENTK